MSTILRKCISLLLFTVFVSVKLVGLHMFTHSDNYSIENCEICEFIQNTEDTPTIACELPTFETRIKHNYFRTVNYEYSYTYYKNHFCKTLFGRPPPVA